MLAPVESDHDPEPMFQGRIQEPRRRRGVDPHDVEAACRHLRKVLLHRVRHETLLPAFGHVEGPIADAANPELLAAQEEELRSDGGTPHDLGAGGPNVRCRFADSHLLAGLTVVVYQEAVATCKHNETSSGYIK